MKLKHLLYNICHADASHKNFVNKEAMTVGGGPEEFPRGPACPSALPVGRKKMWVATG